MDISPPEFYTGVFEGIISIQPPRRNDVVSEAAVRSGFPPQISTHFVAETPSERCRSAFTRWVFEQHVRLRKAGVPTIEDGYKG
jgi:hypothetical protein